MLALPFPDRSFTVVTIGYGLRNVPDLQRSLREIRRVLDPNGRMLSLDFNRPSNPLVRSAYLLYLTTVGSVLGYRASPRSKHLPIHPGIDPHLSRRRRVWRA